MFSIAWFDTREAEAFAKAIAEDLMGRIPVPVHSSSKNIPPERVNNAYQAIVSRTRAFARAHPLNWYKKAYLGNTFKWTLTEKGYDKEFVDTWTHNLLVAVSLSKEKAG